MKVERLRIHALGGLRNLDTGTEALSNLVVLLGSNEAGKTTVMEALRTLLYGFYPARRETHPLTPWDGDRPAELEGWVRSTDGDRLHIQRRLTSQPVGTVQTLDAQGWEGAGDIRELRNADLPGVRHVLRAVYGQTHTLTLPELAAFGTSDPWLAIRDRILAGMGTEDLRSPRLVAAALGEEAAKLWRTDRRGSAEYRALEQALSDARKALREAEGAEAQLREARDDLKVRNEALMRALAERDALRERQREARRILPLLNQAQQLQTLRRQAGDPEALAGLPPDLKEAVARAEGALREEEEAHAQVVEVLARLTAAQPTLGEWDGQLLQIQPSVEALGHHVVAMEEEARQREKETAEVRLLEDEVRELARPLLAPDPEGETTDPLQFARDRAPVLAQLPLDGVQALLTDLSQLQREEGPAKAALAEARSRPLPPPPRISPPSTFRLLLGMGAVVTLAALIRLMSAGDGGLGIPALTLFGGIVLLLTAVWLRRDQARAEEDHAREIASLSAHEQDTERRLQQLAAQRAEILEALGSMLGELILHPTHQSHPREGLVASIRELDRRLRALIRADARASTPPTAQAAFSGTLKEIYHHLGEDGTQALALPPMQAVHPRQALDQLRGHLDEAKTRQAVHRAWQRNHEEESRRVAEASSRLARAQDAQKALTQQIQEVQPDPIWEQSIAILQDRILAHQKAQAMVREWVAAFGSEATVLAQIEPWQEDPHCTPEGLEEAEAILHAKEDAIGALLGEIRALEERLNHAPEDPPDLLKGEIQGIQEGMHEVARTRDRLRVLQALVVRGEEGFRQREQPALLKGAEALLQALTGGRYSGLLLQADDTAALTVRGNHLQGALPVSEPLSTGTREQIWFALRMAALEGVEGGGEPLPMILDEVLVNWDALRREQALQVLSSLSETRQIFLLTCHPTMAEEAVQAGGQLIRLPTPEEVGR